jgi:hypothetical protein
VTFTHANSSSRTLTLRPTRTFAPFHSSPNRHSSPSFLHNRLLSIRSQATLHVAPQFLRSRLKHPLHRPTSKAQETAATCSTRRLPPLSIAPRGLAIRRSALHSSAFPFDLDFTFELATLFLTPRLRTRRRARYRPYGKISRV